MKKVFCSITKLGKSGSFKIFFGIGFIADDNLIAYCKSKAGKTYKRVFEDCIKDCKPIPNRPNEFKGIFYEIKEIEVESKPNSFSTIEITVEYSIWYKLAP